jgi:Protein of unknown function (DUF2934)
MAAPHVTTTRPTARKRPVPAASAAARKAESGIVAGLAPGTAPREIVEPERRRQMIAEAAYYRAEQRGFAPGGELQDWLEAEAQMEAWLRA